MPNHQAHAAAASPIPTFIRRKQRELHDMGVHDGHRQDPGCIETSTHVAARVQAVQTLLREDVYLSAYGAPHLPCPVSFQYVPSAVALSKDELEACLGLVSKTSGHDYKASSVGWNPRKKREEMLDSEMMYLLVRRRPTDTAGQRTMEQTQKTNNLHNQMEAQTETAKESRSVQNSPDRQTSSDNCILGFTSFMFTYDDPPYQDRPVLYIYEIHLEELLRGQGLGPRLIKFVENAAHACQIKKTMLTVFTANKRAKGMYESLGYTRDEASPNDRVTRNKVIKADYLIMSKSID
ncbi:hypothetical protein ACET3X_008014 [Alternaria dauci]|uniref:N-alpha-acetyltransferase 40 n=1 Tax=Alternaria dauci TaxID=48095 RepID=A0ABR3UA16_9PLEO